MLTEVCGGFPRPFHQATTTGFHILLEPTLTIHPMTCCRACAADNVVQ